MKVLLSECNIEKRAAENRPPVTIPPGLWLVIDSDFF